MNHDQEMAARERAQAAMRTVYEAFRKQQHISRVKAHIPDVLLELLAAIAVQAVDEEQS